MNARYYIFTPAGFVCLIDRDLDGSRSVTNDIERIIDEDLPSVLTPARRLVYRDTMGRRDEALLTYRDGVARFIGFAPLEDQFAATFGLFTPAFYGDPSDGDLLAMGYERPFRVLNDGRVATIQVMHLCLVAIVVDIHGYGHSDAFYYTSREQATRALEQWDGTGEPQGWVRHPQSGRRRDDGDPSKEYLRPWTPHR